MNLHHHKKYLMLLMKTEKSQVNLLKKKRETLPFIAELEYDIDNDVYWMYKLMVLQLEDYIDLLKVTNPEFQFLFLFDHSIGRDHLQPDSLSKFI